MSSLAEPEKLTPCRSCGKSAKGGPRLEILGDYVPLCPACITRVRAGVGWEYWLPTKEHSPLPLPEGFDELFRAARVLLEEGAEEDRIIPTLALANHLCHGVPRLVREKERLVRLWGNKQVWDEEADRFAWRFSGLRPVRVVQGVLVLERRSVLITINYVPAAKPPEEVTITVFPYRVPLAKAGEVASLYERALSEAGITHDERCSVRLGSNLYNRRLEISIQPGTRVERVTVTEGRTVPQLGWRLDKEAPFPQPRLVGDLCAALVTAASAEGLVAELPTRRSGRLPEAENLVPACVAFLLKEYGIQPDKEINGWLEDYVLGDTWKLGAKDRDIFRYAIKGTSPHAQVWRDADKTPLVRDPLMEAAWTLFWEGYE